jgi:hypothetical protein
MRIETLESPKLENLEYGISFVADFEFTYATLLLKKNLVAIFIDGWSGDLSFVGKVYDFQGNQVAEIPFPPNGVGGRQNAFWYASENEAGIWVGFHQQNERHFGGVFCLNQMKFISFNEAR